MNRFQILKLPQGYVPCYALKELNLEEIKQQIIRDYIKTISNRRALAESLIQPFFTGSQQHQEETLLDTFQIERRTSISVDSILEMLNQAESHE